MGDNNLDSGRTGITLDMSLASLRDLFTSMNASGNGHIPQLWATDFNVHFKRSVVAGRNGNAEPLDAIAFTSPGANGHTIFPESDLVVRLYLSYNSLEDYMAAPPEEVANNIINQLDGAEVYDVNPLNAQAYDGELLFKISRTVSDYGNGPLYMYHDSEPTGDRGFYG